MRKAVRILIAEEVKETEFINFKHSKQTGPIYIFEVSEV
jgi:hypothetical protein